MHSSMITISTEANRVQEENNGIDIQSGFRNFWDAKMARQTFEFRS